ncbi:von Willebrand factor A domain-containing protein 5B1 isoform X2 [Gouania willdenowi]|uniref:von Willebrand factor A domain-containing protein 5B1 isoform X2 n=1 Tax=Gouania willdenowi TaxID=441366 RepID=UPI0010555903|nr:von Willebrand factor A domain-containing protein 5B1-like isoform X2 [Gouania willdenowi]
MVGLRNRSTWEPLLLKASCIKSCANGCSMGINAQLTYANSGVDSVEGVFVYPLGEKEVVVGFEAVIAGRLMGVQIQSRGNLKECCLDCCPGAGLEGLCENGREWGCCGNSSLDMQCTNGHLILDEDLERTTFIVGTGIIGPRDIVSIIISTTLELPTIENGAIRIVYPTLLTPIVNEQMTLSKNENGLKAGDAGATSCFGATSGKPDRTIDPGQRCAYAIFTNPASNLQPYELNFQLLVRGACLLAGLESPTHALRADADPSAQSASSTYITLAQEHPYDRHIEIILHLSEPHSPLVILERGRLSFYQYEQQICARRDFIRSTRKDSDPERKLEFVRRRHHKDILNSPVLMLNFCPDLLCEPVELHKATRELLFLIDRSGSMSGTNIHRVKEAMVVALKSLPPGTMLNIVGFGTTIKPLFSSSKLCTDVTLMQANDYIQRMRADMRGTNLLGALSWLYQQPMQRSHPRQVFIVTDGTISNVAKVLELVRRNMCAGRCFGLGLGPRACRRLLMGVAKLSGGITEFLDIEERLQPKLIKSLKKAFEPVLTDVRIDWYLPEHMEALLSPNDIAPLYPGDRLIGYCTLYDMTFFKEENTEPQTQSYKGQHSGSTGSVFGQSNDELSPPGSELMPVVTSVDGGDLEEALREISREISTEFSCAIDTEPSTSPGVKLDWSSDVRRRIQETSYIQEQYVLTRCSLSSEQSLQTRTHSHLQASNSHSAGGAFLPKQRSSAAVLDTGSLPQGLEKVVPPEQRSSLSRWADTTWEQNLSAETAENVTNKTGYVDGGEELRRRKKDLARSTMAARSFSSPQGELEMHRLRRALERVSFDQTLGGRLDESDGETKAPSGGTLSHKTLTNSNGLFPASPMDWDSFADTEYHFMAAPVEDPPPGQCRSMIHGLLSGRSMSWVAGVDLSQLWCEEEEEEVMEEGREEGRGEKPWEQIIHQLTARSVIRDFEKMAEKEGDTGHGLAKRHRTKAIQTSKHCNIICMYTAFTTTDSNPNKGSADNTDVQNTGMHLGSRQNSLSGSRRQRSYSIGLGRRRSSRDSEDVEDAWNSTGVGGSAYGSTTPTVTAGSSTRSHRSIESKSMESFFGTKFPLGKLRSSFSSGKQVPLKSHCLSAETEKHADGNTPDYLPLVRLQLASGAFLLSEIYSDCVQIPLDRLKRASPYSLHRRSLSPAFRCTSPSAPSLSTTGRPLSATTSHHVTFSPSACSFVKPAAPPFHHTPGDNPLKLENRFRKRQLSDRDPITSPTDLPSSEEGSLDVSIGPSQNQSHGQVDSGRGSETDVCEGFATDTTEVQGSNQLAQDDLEGSSWATAVALAWLEHRCAGYFMEWELVAAKADFWLRGQELPEGVDLSGLKGAARQLFLLLRHWDENIKLNMLCYNPNNM